MHTAYCILILFIYFSSIVEVLHGKKKTTSSSPFYAIKLNEILLPMAVQGKAKETIRVNKNRKSDE